MSLYYSALAKCNSILKGKTSARFRRFPSRVPGLRSVISRGSLWAAKVLLPDTFGWVKVKSGLAQGIWLRLNVQKERGYWLGLHEEAVQQLLGRLCSPESTFYDIGAHLGFFSFGIAKSLGTKGKVFAFEPDPENCLRFKEMMARNNLYGRVDLVEAAVWSYTLPAGLPFQRGTGRKTLGGIRADGVRPVLADGEERRVPTISLDDFVRAGNPCPDVIKVDVEGGECEVLSGGRELFLQRKPVLICEVHHQQAAVWITDWVAANGYRATWQVPDESFPRLLVAQAVDAPQFIGLSG